MDKPNAISSAGPRSFSGSFPVDWADLTTNDFHLLDEAHTVAVLPVAACEQHGPHLPLGVDTDLAQGIIQAAWPHLRASQTPALFLPTLPVGYSPEHLAFRGTLSLRAETVLALWSDLAAGVARAGLRKMVLFNSHGGQVSVMDMLARQWRAQHGLLVYSTSWFNGPLLDVQGQDVMAEVPSQEQRFGVHGGQVETAMMLALHPQKVKMPLADDFQSTAQSRSKHFEWLGNGKTAKLAWQTQDYNPSGAVGNARAACPQLGQRLVQAAGLTLARLLEEVSRLPLSTLVDPENG